MQRGGIFKFENIGEMDLIVESVWLPNAPLGFMTPFEFEFL